MSPKNIDLLDQLRLEHAEMRVLLNKVMVQPSNRRKALVRNLEKQLLPHDHAEERTLYHELTKRLKMCGLSTEAIQMSVNEHQTLEALLETLKETESSDERWTPSFSQFAEAFANHVEEEENELFSLTRHTLTISERKTLCETYLDMREDYLENFVIPTQIGQRPSQRIAAGF